MADGKVPCSVCVDKPVTCKTLPSTHFHGPYDFSLTRGIDRLGYSNLNYGLAFSIEERQALGIHGLLPPRVLSLEELVEQTMKQIRSYQTDIEKYVYIMELASHHEKLFYKTIKSYTTEILPLVYTPTVGEACQMFSHLYKTYFKALFITICDKGHIYEILKNWPVKDVKAIVVTDGERILGIGDQGIDGVGIPIGKLCLYTALGGIKPHFCLPIALDFGTNSEAKLNDPLYLGLRKKRTERKEYDEFWDEFMQSVVERFGSSCLIQFEDIGNTNAFKLLEKYQNLYCCFNDDIQGTSAVAVAGLLASLRITKKRLIDNIILFQGAGEANIGIAELCVKALRKEGVSEEEARSHIWMIDSKGLIVKNRPSGGMTCHKEAFAHEHSPIESLDEIVREIKPSILIGASSTPGAFTPCILKQMCENTERPIIFALSNPTSRSECTAEDAYKYTDGKCIFASGSPFPPVEFNGQKFFPAQSNNSYCFPGIALGILCSGMKTVDDEVFLVVAECLAGLADEKDLETGSLFPPLEKIVDMVSVRIAQAVMNHAYKNGVASIYPEPIDKISYIRNHQYSTEMILGGVGVDLVYHRHNIGYYEISGAVIILVLEVLWVVTAFLNLFFSCSCNSMQQEAAADTCFELIGSPQNGVAKIKVFEPGDEKQIQDTPVEEVVLCRRSDQSIWKWWMKVLWLENWKKSILYTPMAAVPLMWPQKLWLSYIASGQLIFLAFVHFLMSLKGRHRKKRRGQILNGDIDSVESRFDEGTDTRNDGLPEPIPGSSLSLADSFARNDPIMEI